MSDTEEGAIRKVLVKKEEHLIFTMALETAMRLSEMFTLKKEDIDFEKLTIFLERSKTSRQGRSGKRQIPITSVLLAELKSWDVDSEHPDAHRFYVYTTQQCKRFHDCLNQNTTPLNNG